MKKVELSHEEKLKMLAEFKKSFFDTSPQAMEQRRIESELVHQQKEEMELYNNRKMYCEHLKYKDHQIQYKQYLERKKDKPSLTFDDFLEDY